MSENDPVGARLRATRDKGKEAVWCVVGAGNGGICMAGHLGLMGFPTRLYNRSEEHLAGVRWHGGVELDGEISGFGSLAMVTTDMAQAVAGADIIMVVTPATAHRPLALAMARHLEDGQLVLLNPGRTGGALEFRAALRSAGETARPVVAEAQTFIYASRRISGHKGHIFKIKNEVPAAALPSFRTPEILGALENAFPQFQAGGDVLSTSLENIGAVFHPALILLNAGWIEETRGDFEYYHQGITPAVASVLQRIDDERLAVARALGVRTVSAREWLYLAYDSSGDDLCAAIRATSAYRGIKAPRDIAHRYIFEDVPMSLVPISSIGAQLGVGTPVTDMTIDLACIMHGTDYRAVGRTVRSLGIEGLSVQEIRSLVAEGE